MHARKKAEASANLLINVFISVFVIFPVAILTINSFKTLKDIYKNVLSLPKTFTLDNYTKALSFLEFGTSIRNSVIITVGVTLAVVLFCSMAAWVLARNKTKTSKFIFSFIAIAILVPFQCVMLPLLKIMGDLHMMNRYGLMTINLGFSCSMAIVLFHGFIKNVPIELEEAAAIDGCSEPKMFFTIVMPLIKGISVTVAILSIMALWNDYLLPSLVINKEGQQTLPLRTYLFFGQYLKQWNLGTASHL
jgi:raffinose/stachyose/melibiose transport system permease protein